MYTTLTKDSTQSIVREINRLIRQSSLVLEVAISLWGAQAWAPRLYGLLKIHKEEIPLQPEVSAIGWMNSYIHDSAHS